MSYKTDFDFVTRTRVTPGGWLAVCDLLGMPSGVGGRFSPVDLCSILSSLLSTI